MRVALCLLAASALFAQTPDPQEIIRRSVDRDLLNFERLKNYTYTERDEERSYDKRGNLTKTETETYDIAILGQRAYARLIARDDKPLPEKEARKERQKMDREIEKREHESSEDKAKLEKERQEERKFLKEVPEAFNFTLVGEDTISGQPAWEITAEPKPGYKPKDIRAKIITKMRGRIWVDKAEYQWVKVDAQAIDKLSFGLHTVQIEPGANIHFEQARINDEIWLPAAAKIYADARVLFFKRSRTELDLTFRDYRKFQADSHLVAEQAP
jgi:hypothetical protein